MRRIKAWLAAGMILGAMTAVIPGTAQSGDTVLGAAEAGKMLPEKVYFKGQSATTQLRNSGGVKFADGQYLLAVVVDTSGYSSDVAQRYQAYLIAERPIDVEGHKLVAGIYGVGFVGGQFVVMDVGAHDLFSVGAHHDEAIKRPMPLKIIEDGGKFRLYEGRNYIGFSK